MTQVCLLLFIGFDVGKRSDNSYSYNSTTAVSKNYSLYIVVYLTH